MRAVNLMPEGNRRGGQVTTGSLLSPAYGLVALLAIAVVFVTVYVLASNTVSDRKVKLASLQQQVAAEQAQANQLSSYVNYQRLAESRAATVRQIASSRFDWQAALANLSRVVPGNVAFQSLLATAAPGSSVSGAGGSVGGGAGTGGLRGDIPVPAFEVKGCSTSHDDTARLMSRLRAMPGVQRVTLADSVRGTAATGTTVTGGASTLAKAACGSNPASFDLVVFFQALPGAAAATAVATPAAPASAVTSATTTTTATTTATATATAQPVSNGSAK